MKSLWSLLWWSSTRVLFKRVQHLSEDMRSFPLPSRFSSLPLDYIPFVSVISMWDLHLLVLLSLATGPLWPPPLSPAPFTSCPPLWSGHGSCLYLTNRGGPIPLTSGLWSPWVQDGERGGAGGVWKVEMSVCGVGMVCMCACTHSEKNMCMPTAFRKRQWFPSHRAVELILLCYLNKVAPRAISLLSTHQSHPPTLFLLLFLQVILFSCLLLCSGSLFTHPPAHWSTLHCGGLLPYTVYDSSLKQSIKAMCYQKEYCAAHGLCLNWGGENFRLQYFLSVM